MFEKLRSKLNNTRLTENGSQSLDNTNGGSKTTIKFVNDDHTFIRKYPIVFDGEKYGVIVQKIVNGLYVDGYWKVSIYDDIPNLKKQPVYSSRIPYDKDVDIQGIVINTFRAYHNAVVEEKRREENIMKFLNMQEIDFSDWRTKS